MKDVNKLILVGRLGMNPIQRETKNGNKVAHFSVATSRRIRDELASDTESYKDETQWHQVVAWGRQAEVCTQFLTKGQMAYVEGDVRTRSYVGKDGHTRYATEVHAEKVVFLSPPQRASQSPQEETSVVAEA